MSALELFAVGELCRRTSPDIAFEFGTFEGRTTSTIASNCHGTVFTLDFPPSDEQAKIFDKKKKHERMWDGWYFNVRQLMGDSKTFDFSRYHPQFILIDGGHDKDTFVSDSRNALKMLDKSKDKWCIVWHDYGNDNYPHIKIYLDTWSGTGWYHIAETKLVFHSSEVVFSV